MYVDNIILCVERKYKESMVAIGVEIEMKTLLQVLIRNK